MIDTNRPDDVDRQPGGKLAYKPAEAAELLSISARSLWTLTNQGEIVAIKIGRSVRYPHSELERFLRSQLEANDSTTRRR